VNLLQLRRLRLVALVGILAFAVLFARLFWIQVIGHRQLAGEAHTQQTERVILEPPRGRILDRHLRPLADNAEVSQVSVDFSEVVDLKATSRFVVRTAGHRGAERLRERKHNGYVLIANQLAPEKELALTDETLPQGAHLDKVPTRVYPLEEIGRSVVGLVGVDGNGLEGLERVYDRELQGANGWATLVRDGRGLKHQLPQSVVKLPEAGSSLVSTIDRDAQSIVVMKLREALRATGAHGAMGVFADPRTGDILAMATVDAVDAGQDRYRNRVVADQYEPGSTFKILAGCAALQENVLRSQDSFYVDHGEADFGGFRIHDAHPETAWLTLREATAKSSNVCYAQIGMKVGANTLYSYARLFGFGQPTRIGLPGEAPGQIRHPDHWSARSLATISIGQEVLITPIQLLMAYCAVANGGTLIRPRVATALLSEDGEPVRTIPVEQVRRVLSPETASTFRSFLRDAVLSGTATEAALPWIEVAGKTGTAQKSAPGGRGYDAGRYIASFVGMVPYENPSLVGLIILDEPRGAYYGGAIAAPVFRDIVAAWATQGLGPIRMPAGAVLTQDHGATEAGPTSAPDLAESTIAAPGAFPDLRGLSMRDAIVRATTLLGATPGVRGSGRVIDQLPAPGTPLALGAKCVLTCASPRGR
jgi:cell division protein FtsI (penicillin-binding protein 3)